MARIVELAQPFPAYTFATSSLCGALGCAESQLFQSLDRHLSIVRSVQGEIRDELAPKSRSGNTAQVEPCIRQRFGHRRANSRFIHPFDAH
jgi:hypothetical protein